MSLDGSVEGHQQILRITNFDESRSAYKLQRQDTSQSLTRTSSSASAGEAEFEAKEVKSPITFVVQLDLEGIGISLIDQRMAELLYASFRGIRLRYGDSATDQLLRFSIKWIQIDNQLFGAQYPLLFYPSIIPKDAKELEAKPNLEAALVLKKNQGKQLLTTMSALFG